MAVLALEGPPRTVARSRRTALRTTFVAIAGAAALVLPLAGCTGTSAAPPSPAAGATAAPSDALSSFYAQRPSWSDCGDGFFCSTVQVPRDYANPTAGQIGLTVVRLPATDSKGRLGSLLVNPGGPGVSGIDYARRADQAFTDTVRKAYDIVGFDPRGVGTSDPVDCVPDKTLEAYIAEDASPDTPAEEQRLLTDSKALAAGCKARSGDLLPFVSTRDAARDMDVIRAVVGDPKLNYFGASYGTLLGATYAELFPGKVGRMVLDGALDPTLTATQLAKGQLAGFERALDAFIADCVTRKDCPVGPTAADARRQIDELVAASDATPLRSDSRRPVTQSLVTVGLFYPLYDKTNGWPALRFALNQARGGDGTTLLRIADLYAGRRADGTYENNQTEANYAINCADNSERSSLADVRAEAARLAKESPLFGASFAWSNLPCDVWPVASSNKPHEIHAPGAPPILVVGTTRDPATPYAWAQALAKQLDSGRLLTRDGDGHTGYTSGSACIDNAVDTFLLSATLPPEGTVCR